MKKIAIQHIPDSNYAYAISEDKFVIRLRVARNDDISEIFVEYGCKYSFYTKENRKLKQMSIKYEDDLYSYYEVELELEDPRLGYIFVIVSNGKKYFYSEQGIEETFDYEKAFYTYFQYAHINKIDIIKEVEWFKKAVFYQIFIDRFNRGSYKKDTSYIDMKSTDLPTPTSFYGGDLQGIVEKLDYLKNIGISALYLTPIFKSISNHKYDIIDYNLIDPQFGTDDIFKDLVKKAHERGIKIVIDVVFNHCSNKHEFVQDVLKNGKNSKYYDYFRRKNGKFMNFADCEYMIEWDANNPEVMEYLIDLTLNWIKKYDIDGLRLDVADELPHEFWRRYRKAVRELKEDCVIIAEDWHISNSYLSGDQYDSVMNYAFTKACFDYFSKEEIDEKGLANRLNSLLVRYRGQVNNTLFNLLDSHDKPRFITEVNDNKKKFLAGLYLLFFYAGTPCIYYGTEIALQGEGDPDSRRVFDWSKEPIKEVLDILKYRTNEDFINADLRIYEKDSRVYLERRGKKNQYILILSDKGNKYEVLIREA